MATPNTYWQRRIKHHVLSALLAALFIAIGYFASPPPSVNHRLSMGSAYAAMLFLAATLWLGPWNILRRKHNPVSSDLRRDIGIWAGILAILHTGVGLTVHLRGRMWMYFFKRLHPLAIQNTQFGAANYIGLVSALLFLMLLIISNDISLRSLGTSRWKSLQRWTYLAAFLAVAHGVLFQLVEKRHLSWVIVYASIILSALVIQGIAILRQRREQGSRHGNA